MQPTGSALLASPGASPLPHLVSGAGPSPLRPPLSPGPQVHLGHPRGTLPSVPSLSWEASCPQGPGPRPRGFLRSICPRALGEQGWGESGTWGKVENQGRVGYFPSPSRVLRRAGRRGVCGLPGRGVPCPVPGDTSSRLSRGLRADSAPPGVQGAAPAPPCALGPAPRFCWGGAGVRGSGLHSSPPALGSGPAVTGSRPPARVFQDAVPGGEFPPPPAAAPPSAGRPARQVKLGPEPLPRAATV